MTVEKLEHGYRAVVPDEYTLVGLWLDGDVGEDDSDFIVELWREIGEQTRGERGKMFGPRPMPGTLADAALLWYDYPRDGKKLTITLAAYTHVSVAWAALK